jgi:hypothetical protein
VQIVYSYLPNNAATLFVFKQSKIYVTTDKDSNINIVIDTVNAAIASGQKEGIMYKPAI